MKTNKFLGFVLPNGVAEKSNATLSNLEFNISVCFFVNKAYDGLDPDNQASGGAHTYNTFYKALQKLKKVDASKFTFLIDDVAVESSVNKESPLACFGSNQASFADFDNIKKTLWKSIFPAQIRTISGDESVQIQPDSRLDDPPVKKIESLYGRNQENLTHINKLLRKERGEAEVVGRTETDVSETLRKIHDFGVDKLASEVEEQKMFVRRHAKTQITSLKKEIEPFKDLSRQEFTDGDAKKKVEELKKIYESLIGLNNAAMRKYLEDPVIDIDEIITSYSTLSSEPILMRLMGLFQDLTIPISEDKIPNGDGESFFKLGFKIADGDDICPVSTRIKVKRINGKVAFLMDDTKVEDDMTYYENSILLNKPLQGEDRMGEMMTIVRGDNVSMNYRAGDVNEAAEMDQDDSLTRGLMLTHPLLHKVIEPQQVDQLPDDGITDDYAIGGHRVALKWDSKLYSLTKRDVEVKIDDGTETIYKCDQYEGSINIDTPMQYLEEGEFKSVSSDVLFEYTGELLSLRSAFSKAIKVTKAEEFIDWIDSGHNIGLLKSQARMESKCNSESKREYDKLLAYHKFPFNVIDTKTDFLSMWFNVPQQYVKGKAPKLRFGNEYTFVVSQEYLNGWGLPLSSTSGLQLSVEEIAQSGGSNYTPTGVDFVPLENKKPVKLFARKKIEEDASKPLADRDSLEHMVVRSDHKDDKRPEKTDRHVLPAQLELEPAFWHNLLSAENMSVEESYEIKRRANCSFQNQEDFSKETGKGKTCPEGCGKFCGGMQMRPYYPQSRITPKFLTDPGIEGFSVELFWDEKFEHPIQPNLSPAQVSFGGTAGVKPRSYLLRASGSPGENVIRDLKGNELLDVCLKKGAMVYARLTNVLTEKHKKYLQTNWKFDISTEEERALLKQASTNKIAETSLDEFVAPRNTPKTVLMTHAVKEPVVSPSIKGLGSSPPDLDMIEHLNAWRGDYEFETSILAHRINESTGDIEQGSTMVVMNLKAHFERLDAVSKSKFIDNILPTGALELWMRKEEFVDDPDQIVLNDPKRLNHLPSDPIVTFESEGNEFKLNHKIEFNTDIMSQLKDFRNIERINAIEDAFRALISNLTFNKDLRTSKFEEHEYYLKNISKFKGFFTDEKFEGGDVSRSAEKLEQYALPKLKTVMQDLDKDLSLRFKVLVLNNKVPKKPDTEYAVSTIEEKREKKKKKRTEVTQRGNIVTIYLKRGRLSSGKDERVGIIVSDPGSIYHSIYEDQKLISRAGKDILSDGFANESKYLRFGDIVIPAKDNTYQVGYDTELGIYHFLPVFDMEKQLWKFEVELNIKTKDGKYMHNPFVNFSLIHFQPYSINYNNKLAPETFSLAKDCRISAAVNSTWCYLLPERKVSAYFDKPGFFDMFGEVDLTLSFDYESLHHFDGENGKKVRTNFLLSIQGSDDKKTWFPVKSRIDGETQESKYQVHHSLITKKNIENKETISKKKLHFTSRSNVRSGQRYSHFRVAIIEVEWFTDESVLDKFYENNGTSRRSAVLNQNITDKEEMRLRYVELIY
ncbi:MAG: hypothetical protein AAF789_01035 [Bacteroidota bacterium]